MKMSNGLNFADKLKFDNIDTVTPDKVILEIIEQLKTITHGLVIGKVEPYDGHIFSYKRESSMLAVARALGTSGEMVDIQNDLGEIGYKSYKYEFYVTSALVDTYKYRVMFIKYGVGNYPVKIVLSQGIANELSYSDNADFIFEYDNRDEFENFIYNVLNSEKMISVLQELINSTTQFISEQGTNNHESISENISSEEDS